MEEKNFAPIAVRIEQPIGAAGGPAPVATIAVTHSLNELVVLTFAYANPLRVRPNDTPGGGEMIPATPFAQIVMPRTAFRNWLVSNVKMIRDLPDRDSFGWAEIAELVDGAGS